MLDNIMSMLTVGVVGLVTMFAFLTILLLSLNLRSNWHWGVKAGTIILAGYFWVAAYFSIVAFMGFPSTQNPPEDFRLVWSVEIEPTKTKPGVIYIWLAPMDDTTPIGYEFPYSRDLHKQLYAAKRNICFGDDVKGKFKLKPGEGQDRANYWSLHYLELERLPPPGLPSKSRE